MYTANGLRQYVSACLVSPYNCIGSSSRRDCYVVSDSRMSGVMVAGYLFSLSSCISHCMASLLSGTASASGNEQCKDMKLLRKLAVVWAIKVYVLVNALFSIY